MSAADRAAALVTAARAACGCDGRMAIRSLSDAIRAIAGSCDLPDIELAHAIGQLQAARLQWVAARAGGVRPFDMTTSDDIDTAPYRRVEEG